MDKYVVSRELAQKLMAAGYDQEDTMFMWTLGLNGKYGIQSFAHITPLDMETAYAAPLSDEIMEQLPKDINDRALAVAYYSEKSRPHAGYLMHGEFEDYFINVKPADALAALWIWCKENGYIK